MHLRVLSRWALYTLVGGWIGVLVYRVVALPSHDSMADWISAIALWMLSLGLLALATIRGTTQDACAMAKQGLSGKRVLILDFENAHQFANGYGVWPADPTSPNAADRKLHNGEILTALQGAADAYTSNNSQHIIADCYHGGRVVITYGNSNRDVSADVGSPDFTKIGKAQAGVADDLRAYEKRHHPDLEYAGVGGDLEPTYEGATHTFNLAQGASESQGGPYLDFGTEDWSNGHDWSESDLCDTAYSSSGNRLPLPQIYHRYQAGAWGGIRTYCNHLHDGASYAFRFAGASTSRIQNPNSFGSREAWRLLNSSSNGWVSKELAEFQNG
jgi:hypothetical protein